MIKKEKMLNQKNDMFILHILYNIINNKIKFKVLYFIIINKKY